MSTAKQHAGAPTIDANVIELLAQVTALHKRLDADAAAKASAEQDMYARIDALARAIAEQNAASFTIKKFCQRNSISERQYYKLRSEGKAPRLMSTGRAGVRISRNAERDWIADREREAEAARVPDAAE
jgi:hypothetical protein